MCFLYISPMPLRVVLFGLGRAGRIHLHNLIASPDFDVRYIVEARDMSVTDITCIGATCVRSDDATALDALFADEAVDAVVIL